MGAVTWFIGTKTLQTDNQSTRSFVIPFIQSVDAACYVAVSR